MQEQRPILDNDSDDSILKTLVETEDFQDFAIPSHSQDYTSQLHLVPSSYTASDNIDGNNYLEENGQFYDNFYDTNTDIIDRNNSNGSDVKKDLYYPIPESPLKLEALDDYSSEFLFSDDLSNSVLNDFMTEGGEIDTNAAGIPTMDDDNFEQLSRLFSLAAADSESRNNNTTPDADFHRSESFTSTILSEQTTAMDLDERTNDSVQFSGFLKQDEAGGSYFPSFVNSHQPSSTSNTMMGRRTASLGERECSPPKDNARCEDRRRMSHPDYLYNDIEYSSYEQEQHTIIPHEQNPYTDSRKRKRLLGRSADSFDSSCEVPDKKTCYIFEPRYNNSDHASSVTYPSAHAFNSPPFPTPPSNNPVSTLYQYLDTLAVQQDKESTMTSAAMPRHNNNDNNNMFSLAAAGSESHNDNKDDNFHSHKAESFTNTVLSEQTPTTDLDLDENRDVNGNWIVQNPRRCVPNSSLRFSDSEMADNVCRRRHHSFDDLVRKWQQTNVSASPVNFNTTPLGFEDPYTFRWTCPDVPAALPALCENSPSADNPQQHEFTSPSTPYPPTPTPTLLEAATFQPQRPRPFTAGCASATADDDDDANDDNDNDNDQLIPHFDVEPLHSTLDHTSLPQRFASAYSQGNNSNTIIGAPGFTTDYTTSLSETQAVQDRTNYTSFPSHALQQRLPPEPMGEWHFRSSGISYSDLEDNTGLHHVNTNNSQPSMNDIESVFINPISIITSIENSSNNNSTATTATTTTLSNFDDDTVNGGVGDAIKSAVPSDNSNANSKPAASSPPPTAATAATASPESSKVQEQDNTASDDSASYKDDPNLEKAFNEYLRTGKQTLLIKEELKRKIMYNRCVQGKKELPPEPTASTSDSQLTDEEKIKKKRRQELNRIAAANLRERRKSKNSEMNVTLNVEVERNAQLKETVERLMSEKANMLFALSRFGICIQKISTEPT